MAISRSGVSICNNNEMSENDTKKKKKISKGMIESILQQLQFFSFIAFVGS